MKRPLIAAAAVTVVAALAWLAFGFFGIQAAFIDNEVSEANPFVTALPTPTSVDAEVTEVEAVPAAAPETDTAPEVVTLASGTLVDHAHQGDGTINVITDGNQRFLRFEDDFDIDNGPDLNVYLVRGADADGDPGTFDDDFIDLGDLKGNIGAQNYELPDDIDLEDFDTVVIWCVRFGVAFNAADLA